jgi:hypothetical protein
MDQDALPAVLALYFLQNEKPLFAAVPGLELRKEKSADVVAEFDFVFVRDSKLFAGECKAGTELGEKDFKTARLAAETGIAEYSFCTISQFSNETNSKIASIKAELKGQMEIRVLERSQLLPG